MRRAILQRAVSGLWLGTAAIAFFGCASDPGNKNYLSEPNLPITGRIDMAPTDTSASTLGSDVLAFGRIRWIENGVERTEYRSGWGWNIWFPYIQAPDDRIGTFVVEKDGSFTWKVPKGYYIIYQTELRDPWDGMHYFHQDKFTFEVDLSANAVCLGTLLIETSSSRDLIGGILFKDQHVRIVDDCDTLSAQFHSRYPDPNLVESTSLLRYDPNIPIPKDLKLIKTFKNIFKAVFPYEIIR